MSNDTPERGKPESFVGRWSRMKQRAREGSPEPVLDEDAATVPTSAEGDASRAADATPGEASRMLGEADFADVDFEALDFTSDYTRFMGRNVPDEIRNRALGKLWASNPVLANMDGLDHYIDDYTDEAVAVPMGTLKTAYKFGQGFLSDEEAAEWDRLGKPETEIAAAGVPPDATGAEVEAGLAAAGVDAGGIAVGVATSPAVAAAVAADAWHRAHTLAVVA